MQKQGIYKIVNLVNNKIYIGSSSNLQGRKTDHFKLLKTNKHNNKYLQHSYNKYGKNNFEFTIIENVNDIKDLIKREQYWINKYNTLNKHYGYNISYPLEDNKLIHGLDTKISLKKKALKQHYNGNLNIEKYDNNLTIINNIEKDTFKYKRPKIQRNNKNRNNNKILQINKTSGEVIREFLNIADVTNNLKLPYKRIEDVVSGRIKSYKGYVYIYKDLYDKKENYIIKRKNYIIPVYQYDLNLKFIKEWKGVFEVIDKNPDFNKTSLSSALSKSPHIYKRYYWLRNKL